MRWDKVLVLLLLIACVACLLLSPETRSLLNIRALSPVLGEARRYTPPPMVWPLEAPTAATLPVPLGEPFEAMTYTSDPSYINDVVPYSPDLRSDTMAAATGQLSLYGSPSPPPMYGLMRDNVADLLLEGMATAPTGTLGPYSLQPNMQPLSVQPLDPGPSLDFTQPQPGATQFLLMPPTRTPS